jgi:sugar fermentation stimulation protein A
VVVKRPSATIKSPYVADVRLPDGSIVLAHAPALDVGGMCSIDSTVLMSKRPPGGKTHYAIELVTCTGPECGPSSSVLVGAHPRLGEKLARIVIERNLLNYGPSPSIQSEVTLRDSKVDFVVNGDHVVEVKNVVCADYCLETAPPKLRPNHCVIAVDEPLAQYSRAGLFPWGLKNQTFEGEAVVSERAIKHVRNLASLRERPLQPITRASLLFCVNRGDCVRMRACSEQDPVFALEVEKAKEAGVGVDCFKVRWTAEGKCYWDGVVPYG